MPEHTIPESLIEQIRTGKAALVVGAGIGVPSWKQLLERLTKALETRGRDGDDASVKDLEKLLHKGSLVRAVGFLARALGEDTCDKIVEEVWAAPSEVPPLPKALAQLPFRHVWTTFPGDVLEHAFETSSPDEWPPARVVTYQELGELSPRRRTLVKMLGNFDTSMGPYGLGANVSITDSGRIYWGVLLEWPAGGTWVSRLNVLQ